jgi:hypothetical protein
VRTYKETHPSTVAADEMQAVMQESRDGTAGAAEEEGDPDACALTATTTAVRTMKSLDNMVGWGFFFFFWWSVKEKGGVVRVLK